MRAELRDALDGAAPAQPTAFELPTDMVEIPEILTGWGVLEVRLLEALVLLSADDTSAPSRWEQQVVQAQATGGQIPRWPGWD